MSDLSTANCGCGCEGRDRFGGAVDAAAQFLVTGAVIRRAAVGADNDVVLEGERLAAALTRAAIIFRHKFLP